MFSSFVLLYIQETTNAIYCTIASLFISLSLSYTLIPCIYAWVISLYQKHADNTFLKKLIPEYYLNIGRDYKFAKALNQKKDKADKAICNRFSKTTVVQSE